MTETNDPGYPEYGRWTQPLAQPEYPGAAYPPPPYPGAPYPPPGYPLPGYPPPGYPPAGYPPASNAGARLGARLLRRPTPRFSIVLAGAGAALLLAGAGYWALRYFADGLNLGFDDDGLASRGGGSRRFLGVVLFLGIAAAGYAAAIVRRRGPLATAGAVAAAFGVPLTLAFLTLDASDLFRGQYPFSVDAVFLVSIAAWLVSYFLVPGLRGRSLFLGAAALALFGYVALKASGADSLAPAGNAVFGAAGGRDAGAVTGAGVVFGLIYYAVAAVLDRQGRNGGAVALVVAGFYATAGGIVAGATDMGLAGTGALLAIVGTALCWYGAYFGRRFTAWAWGAGVALGVALIIARIFHDSYTGIGLALMVVGVLVVVAAYAVATATREAPDIEEALAPAG